MYPQEPGINTVTGTSLYYIVVTNVSSLPNRLPSTPGSTEAANTTTAKFEEDRAEINLMMCEMKVLDAMPVNNAMRSA